MLLTDVLHLCVLLQQRQNLQSLPVSSLTRGTRDIMETADFHLGLGVKR